MKGRTTALLVVCLSLLPLALADTLAGRVVRIADGDTFTVLDAGNDQHKIRLAGIDAPEKGQPYGTVSKDHLGKMVFGNQVKVLYMTSATDMGGSWARWFVTDGTRT